jgi:chloramphenicol O-acetyltransferase type A
MKRRSWEQCRKIDLETWPRTAVFHFFKAFTEPFHGVCLRLDCTEAFRFAKAEDLSVFLTLVHCSLVAAHQVENFRTRIVNGEPWLYECIDGGSAVGRPNGTIGFAHYPFHENIVEFVHQGSAEVNRVSNRTDIERHPYENLIRFSTLPWLDFTSISHARNFAFQDSAPRITFGKITEAAGRRTLPVSIHVHHALVDGSHVAEFVDGLQGRLDNPGDTSWTASQRVGEV